jgi:hypothetical protein
MPHQTPATAANRVLVKLRPTASLGAAEARANLRPLLDPTPGRSLGLAGEPRWFVADLPDGAATSWDLAHARVADQLGVAGSDVLFVEPDIVHTVYLGPHEPPADEVFRLGDDCGKQVAQDDSNRKAIGPDRFAWHLEDGYSALGRARAAVHFTEPRTRIAHLDTGYSGRHATTPAGLPHPLEQNFVDRDGSPESAEDPDNRVFLIDNSGHGTGTLGILAGGIPLGYSDEPLGGAPGAEVVPLRIADRVVLLRTSSFARALNYAVDIGVDVVTMSMGGLPMRTWREAVDRAYVAGVCMVSAAGNNYGNLPTRHLVYPARYGRVIAACGVMADGRPYHGLPAKEMQGNYGPGSVMRSALSAYTPNIPWPVFGCESTIRLNGAGTSSATPQIAAAAALWYEKYKAALPRDWRRVEAVRFALFSSAVKIQAHRDKLGEGVLQAADALAVRPNIGLPQTKADRDTFAILRVITGLGLAEAPPREQMFNQEIMQRWLLNPELQEIVPDPEAATALDAKSLVRLMEAIIEDEAASVALRKHVASRYPVLAGKSPPSGPDTERIVPTKPIACESPPVLGRPPHRRLRVYAVDPSLSGMLDTAEINEVTLKVRWEDLARDARGGGQASEKLAGEYLVIDDVDATGHRYDAVDLDDPHLLAQDGWAPSEGNPQFHQQMVYAVAMKTIAHFERALGRPVQWRPRAEGNDPGDERSFVPQLTIRPHALHQANAFYSPHEVALLFGYFEAAGEHDGEQVPGSRVYSCLSHDIVAHETTHALLDGMFRRFNEPSNPDVLALHEAFADIVALLQHFTIPEVLENEIRRTRGDIEAESILGSLAVQFGRASGGRGALRDAIGRIHNGVWRRLVPDPAELQRRLTPHSRGAILVAAVFDAFLAIYKKRTADLLRIYTGGTGVLPSGAIHPDLVDRLAEEAAKSAGHVLTMCIRALDYLPPVDVTFFEYLRALITADFDLVRADPYNYRLAFVEAFRRHGIYPVNLDTPTANTPRTLSVDTLRWHGIDLSAFRKTKKDIEARYASVIGELKKYADACLYINDRKKLFTATLKQRRRLQLQLEQAFAAVPDFARALGLDPEQPFEVHELRRAMRISPDGRYVPQIIVALTQSQAIPADETDGTPAFDFHGGATLVVDLSVPEIKYAVSKRLVSQDRRDRTRRFVRESTADPLRALFFSPDAREPFAALHSLADEGL